MSNFSDTVGRDPRFAEDARVADEGLDDIRERLIVDLSIHKAQSEYQRYRLIQLGAFLAVGGDADRMGYESFEAWLGSRYARRDLFTHYKMVDRDQRYGYLFGVAYEAAAAQEDFLLRWPARLRRVVNKINEDVLMAGLPPVKLVDAFDEGKFEFTIQFVVPSVG